MSGAIPLLHTYAFAAWTETTYTQYHSERLRIRNSYTVDGKAIGSEDGTYRRRHLQKTAPTLTNHIIKKLTNNPIHSVLNVKCKGKAIPLQAWTRP
jgi:hypothetical protein